MPADSLVLLKALLPTRTLTRRDGVVQTYHVAPSSSPAPKRPESGIESSESFEGESHTTLYLAKSAPCREKNDPSNQAARKKIRSFFID